MHVLLREFKQLLTRLPQRYPDDEKCIHLLNALPKAVTHGRMTDPGTLESWKDFARLCRYAKNEWTDPFKEYVKESKLEAGNGKRGKSTSGSYAMAVKRPRVEDVTPAFKPEEVVPKYLRWLVYKQVQTLCPRVRSSAQ